MDEQVLERIDALAAKLGVVGEHLWDMLLRQVYVDAAMGAFWVIAAVCLFAWTMRGFRRHRATIGGDFFLDETAFFWLMGLCLVSLAAFFAVVFGVDAVAVAILNPEYAALRKVLP